MKQVYKTICTLVGGLFVAQAAIAQQGLLWRVKGQGHTGFVYGTMHTGDSIANSMDSTVFNALYQCQTLLLEGDLGNIPDPLQMLEMLKIPEGELSQFYSDQEWLEVDSFLHRTLDPMGLLLKDQLRPIFVLFLLQQQEELERTNGDRSEMLEEAMDMRFHRLAQQHEVETVGLEAWNEQLESASSIPLQQQAEMLLEAARGQQFNSIITANIVSSYYNQDLTQMAKEIEGESALYRTFFDAVLYQRNDRFIERALPYFTQESTFMAVGALHLAGDRGVLQQLRDRGFVVEHVPFTFQKLIRSK